MRQVAVRLWIVLAVFVGVFAIRGFVDRKCSDTASWTEIRTLLDS